MLTSTSLASIVSLPGLQLLHQLTAVKRVSQVHVPQLIGCVASAVLARHQCIPAQAGYIMPWVQHQFGSRCGSFITVDRGLNNDPIRLNRFIGAPAFVVVVFRHS